MTHKEQYKEKLIKELEKLKFKRYKPKGVWTDETLNKAFTKLGFTNEQSTHNRAVDICIGVVKSL
jgi:hypothetical protein